MRQLLSLIAAICLTGFSFRRVEELPPPQPSPEGFYLPNGTALEFLSFGYPRVLSHVLWFDTISYFAKHYRSDRDYRWLSHMCGLVSRLNPSARHVYEFCGMMLAWEGNQPEESLTFFSRGEEEFPSDWLFPYLKAFTYVFFLGDENKARDGFVRAAGLPGAPAVVVRLASKKMASMDSPEMAAAFLEQALRAASDETSRGALEERLREVYYELGFRQIEGAAKTFEERMGRRPSGLEELASAGLVSPRFSESHFSDPFGGHYLLDVDSGEVKSTSNRKRGGLHWKRHEH